MSTKWHDINDPGWLPPKIRREVEEKQAAEARENERIRKEYDEWAEQEAERTSKKPEFSNERWEHGDSDNRATSPDTAFEGDEILLKANWKDMVEGAGIKATIRDTTKQPWQDLYSVDGRLGKNHEVTITWKVKLPQSHTPQSTYGFEFYYSGSYGTKYSATCPIRLAGKATCDFVEIPDTLFHPKSAIPQLDDKGVLIGALCAVFQYAKENQGAQSIVFGHATAEDEGTWPKLEVSRQRAIALKALLSNDEEMWIDCMNDFSDVKDIQRFLTTLSSFYSWPCDPKGVDGKIGPGCKAAIRKYKSEFNKRFSGSLSDTDEIDYQLYRSLLIVLRQTILNEYTARTKESSLPPITWNTIGAYGCSDSFAPDAKLNKSQKGSRIELVLLPKGTSCTLTEHTDSKTPVTVDKCPIYGNRFERKSIPFNPVESKVLRIEEVEGPATLTHNGSGVYSIKRFSRVTNEEERKQVDWAVMIDGKENERHEKVGDRFTFPAVGKYVGQTITVHPFLRSPSSNLCVKTSVGPCLVFDGKKLSWIDEAHKELKSWPAASGEKGQTDPKKEGGPIPVGRWVVLQSKRQQTPGDSWWQQVTNKKALEEFGTDRIELVPFKTTETNGRKGPFFIHGGKEAGTAHGIDLVDKMREFIDRFVKDGRNLVLVVKGDAPVVSGNKQSNMSFRAFCDAIGKRESNNNYSALNQYGFMGKYQFGMARLMDLTDMVTRKDPKSTGQANNQFKWNDGFSQDYFLENPQVQENAFREHVKRYVKWAKAKFSSQMGTNKKLPAPYQSKALGRTITEVKISLSGIVGGAHLKGPGGVEKFLLQDIDGTDANGTHISEYIYLFADYDLSEVDN